MSTSKQLAEMREEIYSYLRSAGFFLGMKEQKGLSKLLKSYHEQRVIEIESNTPQEHVLKCPSCLGVKIKSGKTGKLYVKKLKELNNNIPEDKSTTP